MIGHLRLGMIGYLWLRMSRHRWLRRMGRLRMGRGGHLWVPNLQWRSEGALSEEDEGESSDNDGAHGGSANA